MVGVELEVMAKKTDRFGWDRDRGTMAHDRLVEDWMDALQDYPLSEIKAACRQWILNNPTKTANEGGIVSLILKARRSVMHRPSQQTGRDPHRKPVTAKEAERIMAESGYRPKRMEAAE